MRTRTHRPRGRRAPGAARLRRRPSTTGSGPDVARIGDPREAALHLRARYS